MSASTFEKDYSTTPSTLDDVETSIRLPVLHSIFAGAFWLVLGTLLLLVSLIQLTGSSLFADCAFLTHGKTKPAAWIALLYGFALQMGIALAITIVCRRSRKALRHPFTVFMASKVWNLGVVLGIGGVLIGDSSGHRLFELPVYSSCILFLAFAVITLKLLLVLHFRVEREMYIGQMYMTAGLFWFLWALSTAIVLLQVDPVPGATQLVVGNWYVNSVFQVVLGCFGLGALCYYIPQQAGRPLYSQELAAAAFWMLVFIGGWTGLVGRYPLPVWISAVSSAASLLLIIPLATLAYNLWRTMDRDPASLGNTQFIYLMCAFGAYVLWSVLGIVYSRPGVADQLQFTHFETGLQVLFIYGFIGMVGLGACCTLLPRLIGSSCDSNGPTWVLRAMGLGTGLTAFVLLLAGWFQGAALSNGKASFMVSVDEGTKLVCVAVVGVAILALGSVLFFFGVTNLIVKTILAEYPVLNWFREEEEVAP